MRVFSHKGFLLQSPFLWVWTTMGIVQTTVNVDTIEGKQESCLPFPVKESFLHSESDD